MNRIAALFVLLALALPLQADTFDTARVRWRYLLLGPSTFNTSDPALSLQVTNLTNSAQGYWNTLDTSPSRTNLWSDLAGTTKSSYLTSTYARLKTMATAYSTYGSSLKGNATLLADLTSALDWMNANRYTATTTSYDNWWDWQIGVPVALNDIITILYDQLSASQVSAYLAAEDRFIKNPATAGMTGANLMWEGKIYALRGVLGKDGTRIATATSALTPLFTYVTTGDGFYRDGSFIQHTAHPYTGSYGLSLITDIQDYLFLYSFTGTDPSWPISSANAAIAYDWMYRAFEPNIYKGEMFDDLRGRAISRYDSPSHRDGRIGIAAFIRASQTAPAADAAYFKSAVKYWLNADTTYTNPCDGFGIYNIVQAETIFNDSAVVSRGELTDFFAFAGMDRYVHLRPGWGASLSMHSSRIYNFELGNSENIRGWHTGDGMLYVYTADENQFSQNLWPTVDGFRLPGTTVEAGVGTSNSKKSGTSFVGGVKSYGGEYGMTVMDLSPYNSTLRGHKAWFFFDDEIVCLGTGITATAGHRLETIVENRRLSSAGTNAVNVNGSVSTTAPQAEPGSPYTFTGVNYVHITGNVSGGDIGFYFPGGPTLKALRESRNHAWSEINQGSARVWNTTLYNNNFYALWFDHGIDPAGASYSYAILPNYSSSAVQSYATAPEYTVLENSSDAQAVKETTLNATAVTFWQAANHTVGSGSGSITSSTKASVFVRNNGYNLEVAVSDPTQLNTGNIVIDLGLSALSVLDSDPAITVNQLSPTIRFTVAASNLRGVSQRIRFNLNAQGVVVLDNNNANNPSGSFATTGTWTASTGTAGYWANDYLHNGNTGQGTQTATYSPNFSVAGKYEVQAWYTAHSNRATNVPIDVTVGASTTTSILDQTTTGSQWVTLTEKSFGTGSSGSVKIRTDATNGYVVADAVRFVLR